MTVADVKLIISRHVDLLAECGFLIVSVATQAKIDITFDHDNDHVTKLKIMKYFDTIPVIA